MTVLKKIISLILLFVIANKDCDAQDSISKKQKLDSILNTVDIKFAQQTNNDSLMNTIVKLSKEDSALKKAISEYYLFGLDHRKKALQWNLTSSVIIFWSVIFLVFSGILFAGIQFYTSLHNAKNKGSINAENLSTELEASLQGGIKVSSPVLGVIILVISFLFFYLYLKYVYPITEIF
jgi:hypothetical protein